MAGVGLVVGLLIGVAGAGGDAEPAPDDEASVRPLAPTVTVTTTADAAPTEAAPVGLTQADLDRAVDEAEARGTARTQRLLAKQQARSTARLRTVRQQARTDQRVAVRAAVRKTKALAPPPAEVPAVETPVVQTDPQFSYCYEANDAGYGNYVSGVDPEYDWYDDADGDGRVCEF
ncbi:excalibur calcium-binding domain-containing protein [Nocardioides marinquilinus]|uniref:excalibur calcium-binding domain-containing protein n=1 Tax=Nocardioides marinquilinus TaxID=1210400 RepID=UPI0031F06316